MNPFHSAFLISGSWRHTQKQILGNLRTDMLDNFHMSRPDGTRAGRSFKDASFAFTQHLKPQGGVGRHSPGLGHDSLCDAQGRESHKYFKAKEYCD